MTSLSPSKPLESPFKLGDESLATDAQSASEINQQQHQSAQGRKTAGDQSSYLDSDFWFHKGVVLNQKDENESAVQCYEQALKINNEHLPSIFNLACNLEKLKRYEESRHWFEHAIKVKPDWPDALYGLTLVSIRCE